MKREGNLYEKIISINNLKLASKRASRKKKKQKSVNQWNKNIEQNVLFLHEELANQTYNVSKYSVITIHEPKERLISRLPFRDRVVHHAILNYIEEILRKTFIAQTYSCIKGRGVHKALNDLTSALQDRARTEYCLKMDIKKFYPSIDNELLKSLLRTKFKDQKLLLLLDKIIDSHHGLPLGNYTSQWLANFYLNKFDHWMKETKGIKYYFRYCDDMVILGDDKAALHDLRIKASEYLNDFSLTLSKYQVFPVKSRGINFLGYKSYHTHIMLRPSIKDRFKRMVMNNPNRGSLSAYNGWITHCNGKNLWKKYTKEFELRNAA